MIFANWPQCWWAFHGYPASPQWLGEPAIWSIIDITKSILNIWTVWSKKYCKTLYSLVDYLYPGKGHMHDELVIVPLKWEESLHHQRAGIEWPCHLWCLQLVNHCCELVVRQSQLLHRRWSWAYSGFVHAWHWMLVGQESRLLGSIQLFLNELLLWGEQRPQLPHCCALLFCV